MISTATTGIENLTINIHQEIHVRAPLEVTFTALLEQLGPGNETPQGPMPMKLEPWPGGRWYRDLGDSAGHFWGHVQAIKRPTLLEITGPLFMSYPVMSNLQYRVHDRVDREPERLKRREQHLGGRAGKLGRVRERAEGKGGR